MAQLIVNIWTGHHTAPSCQSTIQQAGVYSTIEEILYKFGSKPEVQCIAIMQKNTGDLIAKYNRVNGQLVSIYPRVLY